MKPYTFKHAVKAVVNFGEYTSARKLREVIRQDCPADLDVSNDESEFIKLAIVAGPNSPERAKYVNSKRFKPMRDKWLKTYLTAIGEYNCQWCKTGHTLPWSNGGSLFVRPTNKFCSRECSKAWQGSDEYQTKRKQEMLDKYGVENPMQLKRTKMKLSKSVLKTWNERHDEILAAMQKTCRQNHGVSSPQQSRRVKAKSMQTMLERHGVEHAQQSENIRRKTVATNMKNLGVPVPSMNKDVRKKTVNTCLRKYGVPVSLMASEVRSKSAKAHAARKLFTTATGRTISLQGYEPFVASWLESKGFSVDSAERLKITIPYLTPSGSSRHYFPDLCAKSPSGVKHLVEVKSNWWVKQKGVANKFKYAQLASEARGWGDYVLVVWCAKANAPLKVFKGRKGYKDLQDYLKTSTVILQPSLTCSGSSAT